MKEEGRKYGLMVLAAFVVWTIGSVYAYTCSIKGFCNIKVKKVAIQNEIEIDENNENNEKNVVHKEVRGEKQEKKLVKKDLAEAKTVKVQKIVTKKRIKCLTYLNSYIKLNSSKNYPSEVRKLEEFLNQYYDANLEINEVFEEVDLEALKKFQKSQNLEEDGILGSKTLEVLNAYYCIKNQK